MSYLIKNFIFSPKKILDNIDDKRVKKDILFIFLFSLLCPLIRSFFMPLKGNVVVAMQFSTNPLFNLWLNLAKYPLAILLFYTGCYFLFIFIIYTFMKVTGNSAKFKSAFIGLASISIAGIFARILTSIFNLIGLGEVNILIFYIFYILIIIYSLYVIKNIFKATWGKSIFAFVFALTICIPFAGLLSIAPYLIWL